MPWYKAQKIEFDYIPTIKFWKGPRLLLVGWIWGYSWQQGDGGQLHSAFQGGKKSADCLWYEWNFPQKAEVYVLFEINILQFSRDFRNSLLTYSRPFLMAYNARLTFLVCLSFLHSATKCGRFDHESFMRRLQISVQGLYTKVDRHQFGEKYSNAGWSQTPNRGERYSRPVVPSGYTLPFGIFTNVGFGQCLNVRFIRLFAPDITTSADEV